ncbi:hypothetical protein [Lysinibacillus sp. FSL M8-0134]
MLKVTDKVEKVADRTREVKDRAGEVEDTREAGGYDAQSDG